MPVTSQLIGPRLATRRHPTNRYAHLPESKDTLFSPTISISPRFLLTPAQSGPSLVLLRGEPLVPEARGSALLLALQECESELEQGAIVSLDWSGRPRARVLPLK